MAHKIPIQCPEVIESLTAVSGKHVRLALHEALIGADGVLAAPGTTHRASKLFTLILVCKNKKRTIFVGFSQKGSKISYIHSTCKLVFPPLL